MFKISRHGLRAALVLAAALAVGTQAQAATIDFGSDSWQEAEGKFSHSVGSVIVTANPFLLSVLDWHSGDGIGITTLLDREPTEINNAELLRVRFVGGTTFKSFTVSNLFPHEGFLRPTDELGYYSIDGGEWIGFSGNAGNGLRTVNLGGVSGSTIDFKSTLLGLRNDFSVQQIAVPEPTSLMLVGAGLIAGAARLRRRK